MKIAWILCCLFILSGCSSLHKDLQLAEAIAVTGQLSPTRFQTDHFVLKSWHAHLTSGKDMVIYIEGDGMAWLSRNQISPDPTPNDPIALSLAAIESSQRKHNVVYLARPCQYVTREESPQCHSRYWGKARYAPEVIHSFNQVLTQLATQYQTTGFHLVGYSGGATVALLLAAQRHDILSLTTVAGNVHPSAFSRLHSIDQLTESLDPVTMIDKIKPLPQRHYVGHEDSIVPISIAQAWHEALLPTQRKLNHIEPVLGVNHHQGWQAFWHIRKNHNTVSIQKPKQP